MDNVDLGPAMENAYNRDTAKAALEKAKELETSLKLVIQILEKHDREIADIFAALSKPEEEA